MNRMLRVYVFFFFSQTKQIARRNCVSDSKQKYIGTWHLTIAIYGLDGTHCPCPCHWHFHLMFGFSLLVREAQCIECLSAQPGAASILMNKLRRKKTNKRATVSKLKPHKKITQIG